MSRHPAPLRLAAPVLFAVLATACVGHKKLIDPTLVIRGPKGDELGVSTDYGIVFLGHSATAGDLEVTAWFGDGPSIERSSVEPVGYGLYTAETEIRLPTVGFALEVPPPGTEVVVLGRRGWQPWRLDLPILEHPRVDGILLPFRNSLEESGDQIGAGVYIEDRDKQLRLLGLVSGKLRMRDERGKEQQYLTVVGPEDLWRLIIHRREVPTQRRWVYREDIL